MFRLALTFKTECMLMVFCVGISDVGVAIVQLLFSDPGPWNAGDDAKHSAPFARGGGASVPRAATRAASRSRSRTPNASAATAGDGRDQCRGVQERLHCYTVPSRAADYGRVPKVINKQCTLVILVLVVCRLGLMTRATLINMLDVSRHVIQDSRDRD